MSEAQTGRQYERWLSGPSLTGKGYHLLASVPGSLLINTPVFKLDQNLVLKPGHRLLDIGCGRASLLQVLTARVAFEHPPVGLDLSRRALAAGLAAMEAGGKTSICLIRGSALGMPLAADSFDIVTCSYLVKHLNDADLARMLGELLRVLKPGGFSLIWEFGPTRSRVLDRWNRWLLTRGVSSCNLRGYARLAAAATSAGFEWVENAHLRPFLFPPIPRVSIVVGKAPEAWRQRTGPGRARRTAIDEMTSGRPS